MNNEKFEEKFPSLKGIKLNVGNIFFDSIIDKHCLDKAKVKEYVEEKIKMVEPLITPDGLNNVSAGYKIAMDNINEHFKLGIDMKKYTNEFLNNDIISTNKVKEILEKHSSCPFTDGRCKLGKYKHCVSNIFEELGLE